ncbi:hypothetical protein BDV93DRAFT_522145 [Ceratobasidium sp. AG-I]|nr:hypothetical protein BDV93DRAFT_522145 [Ceratobasidium sp. AG-I]
MAGILPLPNETLYVIISYLHARRDLAALCLASRDLNTLVFPILYETLYLGLASHIESIIQRIAAEVDFLPPFASKPQISPCIRSLIFDDEKYTTAYDREQLICHEVVSRLENIIPRLVNLESLAWKSHWLPRNTKIFKSLRTHCPRLRSVEIQNWTYPFAQGKDGYADSLYGFVNLEHMSVMSKHLAHGQRRFPQPIIQMIRSSPDLITLELFLESTGAAIDHAWAPSKLFETIDLAFPKLRVVRFGGSMIPQWPLLFTKRTHFRTFFEQHPSLHTISLGWTRGLAGHHKVDAETVASLFPSLRHFEGPAFVCTAILSSPLSFQLESLSILDKQVDQNARQSNGQELDLMSQLAASASSLPKLRSLQIYVESESPSLWRAVREITRAAPNLDELGMHGVYINQRRIVEIIGFIPKLRRLTAGVGLITPKSLHAILGICPLLEELHDNYKTQSMRSWRVVRRSDGSAELCSDGALR